ncbi:hypothetical protein F3Y22_tig00111213pilonHSYRG00680 [Hibiscus syriacus]|uniref:X8 domain-containing protein n=1 Tax=Hibiscus syriacus TaxID=106335 RepID=A0A6A2YUX0_HIBSY|nr:hypothetical protein F3Y22_tig00111213pilonHSYRG00680 [Hibiscus syriacus]
MPRELVTSKTNQEEIAKATIDTICLKRFFPSPHHHRLPPLISATVTEANGNDPDPNDTNDNADEANVNDPDPNKKMFCVPTNQASDAELLKALDWACGQGIDCGPIQPGAVCGNPPTIRSRAAFAMNSYYRSKGGLPGTCDFSGTATLVTEDPSYGDCKYV